MAQATIDRLIVNSPYEEPVKHWRYDRGTRLFDLVHGRRPAGYIVASPDSKAFDDPGVFVEIPLVNLIRPRVKAWRKAGYPGVTGMTRRLLEYWNDPAEFDTRRFFFCQLEAAETLIWLTEAPEADRVGVEVPSDGGAFHRLCAKMATGSGKTVVMAMVIAWHVLNKVAYPQDARFARHVLVIAPGLTVRSRLPPPDPSPLHHYIAAVRAVPPPLADKLRRGKVAVRNWHALNWETEEKIAGKRGVDKRGAKSDEAWVREVLGEMAAAHNVLVINDEAHHAWRVPTVFRARGVAKGEIEEATKWVGGLDRIHRTRGILACYDFSATPLMPSGKRGSEESLLGWIVSDFGLNDAIESGLVKTPRVVIHDDAMPDARTWKSRLYHIYDNPEVKADLNRPAGAEESLPNLVLNGYNLLGYDWRETARDWARSKGSTTPPVMITIANRTETAARIKHAFDRKKIRIDELCDPAHTLHIDSKVLADAEAAAEPVAGVGAEDGAEEQPNAGRARKLNKKQQAELLRRQVDTVGRRGREGEGIRNVISVGMLSEGWDAKTVTHIMGLRAFTSQLLCEQVVGRGLRRTSYEHDPKTHLLKPEYVNIFGIPFTFLPHEDAGNVLPPPPPPKTAVEPVSDKLTYEISWPNVVRIDRTYRPRLSLDWTQVRFLELDASQIASVADLAPIIEGKPDTKESASINLKETLAKEFRTQRIVFETARDIYDQMQEPWQGGRACLLAQLVRLVEQFIDSDRIRIMPELFNRDDLKRRFVITLNMTKLVQHIWEAVRFENTERLEPVFDQDRPIRSTSDMRTWYTGKPCEHTYHSHINVCVFDSTWEASDAFALDHSPEVAAWVKNDHLGFEVIYIHRGVVRKYRPDFLVRLRSGNMLVLETKGRESDEDRTKRRFLADEWIGAVNAHGGFGRWSCDVARSPAEIQDILARHMSADGT